jgi:predicted kinase
MIVQLAGLPGTGKSTLAAALRDRLGPQCLVLDKDRVRHALYGTGHVDYGRAQDDFVVSLLHQAAARHLAGQPQATVILERTCTRAYQIADVVRLAASAGQPLAVIECACPDHVARTRLASDRRNGGHPAANRDFTLYQELRAAAEPITIPALRLRTEAPLEKSVARALDYLSAISAARTVPAAAGRP